MFGLLKKIQCPSLVILPLLSSRPHKQEEGLGCQKQACGIVFAAMPGDAEHVLPCHTRVCAQEHQPWAGPDPPGSLGCRGGQMPGHWQPWHDPFCRCESRRWEGWGWRRKGRVEGCNAWLEKFRGVQRRARWKGVAAERGKEVVKGLAGRWKEIYVRRVPGLGAGSQGVGGAWQPRQRSSGALFASFLSSSLRWALGGEGKTKSWTGAKKELQRLENGTLRHTNISRLGCAGEQGNVSGMRMAEIVGPLAGLWSVLHPPRVPFAF